MPSKDKQVMVNNNTKRSKWRSKCRQRLSDHIADTLGIYIKPINVRLKLEGEEEMPYKWHIEKPELEPIFKKQLSRHSVGVYMQLYVEVGSSFWAILPGSKQASLKPSPQDQIESLQAENTALLERLKFFEAYATEMAQEKERLENETSIIKEMAGRKDISNIKLEGEVSNLKETIQTSTLLLSNYEREIQEWTSTAQCYEAYRLQYIKGLNQVTQFLQGLKDGMGPPGQYYTLIGQSKNR
ncbi:hypothetical protein ABOM_012148 [Aspergillus bombycis]|uniref:Uncharacterized protein n=1 Tax=Aspergillus bombycis TaxID=109264 RepID=A0A1F7ZJH0_9EURO|nr:hypothetical protein ABOM_012148 [Aspergillus bombycis]OGM39288.1 hypothetical protein ABOM_012148 [Aspergillus bombycis]